MDLKKMATSLDSMIESIANVKKMSKAEFFAYAKDQVEKANAEKEPEKKKKRLEALRKVVTDLEKSSWEGTHEALIPVYVDPGQYQTTEEARNMQGGAGGTMAEGQSYAAAGGAQSFAKLVDDAIADLGKAEDDEEEIDKKKTEKVEQVEKVEKVEKGIAFAWPKSVSDASFMRGEIAKRGGEWGADGEKSLA